MGVMEWMNEDNGHGHGNVDVDVCGWRMYLYVMDRLEKVTGVFLVSFSSSLSQVVFTITGLELKRISRELMSGRVEYRACCNGGNCDDIPRCVINTRRSVCSCVRV
jgi:hypothetical protein